MTGVKEEGRREMRVNERDIWEDDREVKLCRAQQSCSKRGESGWVLDRGIRHTEYHRGTNYAVE